MDLKKTAVLLFILALFLHASAERFIVEFPSGIPDNAKGVIHRIDRLNMIAVEGSEDMIRSMFPDAVYIHRDMKVKAAYIPDDPYFPYQWNLGSEHYNLSFMLDRGITGSKSVLIGILDTGVAYKDADIPLNEALLVSSTDGTFHKYPDFNSISFSKAYDFVSSDSSACDMNGHGTAVCGIIASGINNATYLSGLVYNASVMPLRVLDEAGEGYVSDIVSGIEYAIDNGVRVLNLSLAGMPGDSSGWHPLHAAIIDARNHGIITVCATGNDGVAELSYPAAFDEAIAVGAVDYFMDRADYSQYGDNLDFMAPGGKVYQDINNDGEYDGGIVCPGFEFQDDEAIVSNFTFYYMEGTSFACPHITALIALAYSIGYNDPDEIENLLIESSIDLGDPGYDQQFGWGYPLPESLFSEELSARIIAYEHATGSFTAYARSLDQAVIDSMRIKGRFLDTLFVFQSEQEIMQDMGSLNTGFYSLYFYYTDTDGEGYVKRDVVLKSPLDNTGTVYFGESEIGFASAGLVELYDRSMKIQGTDGADVFFNSSDRGILMMRSDNVAYDGSSYIMSGDGYYYLINKEVNEEQEKPGTMFVNEAVMINGSYTLIDKCGRVVEKGEGMLNMANRPAGLYLINTEEGNCKLIKLR